MLKYYNFCYKLKSFPLGLKLNKIFEILYSYQSLAQMCWNLPSGKLSQLRATPQPIGLKMLKITWGTKIL